MTRQEEKQLEKEFFNIVARLNSPDEPTHADADAELQSLSTEKLSRIWEVYRRRQKIIYHVLSLASVGISVTSFLMSAYWHNLLLLVPVVIAPIALFALTGYYPFLGATQWEKTVRILARSEDVRVIEPLVQLLAEAEVSIALKRLLPRLKPSDALWFRQEERDRLRRAIFPTLSTVNLSHLREPFLRGMAAIGDRNTLVNITLAIIRDAPTEQDQHLRDVARECLPVLLENAFGNRVEEIPALIEILPAVPAITTGMVTQKHYIAVLGLAHLLPRLTPADVPLLTTEHRKRLCVNLGGLNLKEDFVTLSRLGPDYSLAVVGALTRFGGEESLATLERCAEGKYRLWQLAPQDERKVQLAASLALPVVKARVAAARESEMLLRGSQAPEPSGEILLRATSYTPEAEPQQLLRASSSDSERQT